MSRNASFFGDRATLLYPFVCRLSVCNVCIVAKRCVLPKSCLKTQIKDGNRMVTWPMTSR